MKLFEVTWNEHCRNYPFISPESRGSVIRSAIDFRSDRSIPAESTKVAIARAALWLSGARRVSSSWRSTASSLPSDIGPEVGEWALPIVDRTGPRWAISIARAWFTRSSFISLAQFLCETMKSITYDFSGICVCYPDAIIKLRID